MAAETLSSISGALSQLFAPELQRQFNRTAVLLSKIPVAAGQGDAKNVSWAVQFSGATAADVAEGSDVAGGEFNQDVPQQAVLQWATYRSSFQISENEIDAAARSTGSATALMDMFGERILDAGMKLADVMDGDAFTGTGSNGSSSSNIVGIYGGALDATGTYAGIARGSYSEWAGNVLANGGVARPLTLDLLYQLEQNIFAASGEAPDLIVCSPGVFRKYAGLFESIRRIPGDGGFRYDTGPSGSDGMFFKGIPVVRDRKNSSGYLAMLNTKYMSTRYLPHRNPGDAFGYMATSITGASGANGNGGDVITPTGIPARVVLLSKTGDSVKGSVKAVVQLCNRRPNASGYIKDISEV